MIRWISLLSIMLFSTAGFATEPLSAEEITKSLRRSSLVFAAPDWDGYTNTDGTGLYWEILKEVYEPLGFELRLQNMPFNRSMRLMTKYRTVDGVPGEKIDSEFQGLTYSDLPLEPEYLAIAYRKGSVPKFNEYPVLTGKRVGWRRGYNLLVDKKYGEFDLREFNRVENGLALLEAGRIDVLVDELAEIEAAAEKEGVDLSQFQIDEFVTGGYYYMVFGDSVVSQPLSDIYNIRIKELAQAGKLIPLYNKWGIDVPTPVRAIASGR